MARGEALPARIIELAKAGHTIGEISLLTKREGNAIRNCLNKLCVPYKHERGESLAGYGPLLREYRHSKMMTQQELGLELGLSFDSIRSYETGRRNIPCWIVGILLDWKGETDGSTEKCVSD